MNTAGASLFSPVDAARARMLLELLFIRSGTFCLDSDVKVLIDGLCTLLVVRAYICVFLFFFSFFSVFGVMYFEYDYDIIINI